jgi:hypothetical protein
VRDEGRGSTGSLVQYTLRCGARIEFSAFKTDEGILESGAAEIFIEPVNRQAGINKNESEFQSKKFQSKEGVNDATQGERSVAGRS